MGFLFLDPSASLPEALVPVSVPFFRFSALDLACRCFLVWAVCQPSPSSLMTMVSAAVAPPDATFTSFDFWIISLSLTMVAWVGGVDLGGSCFSRGCFEGAFSWGVFG